MVAEIAPERGWRGPGCDDRCKVIQALIPGRFGRSELLLHSPDVHEEYGRALGSCGAARHVVTTGCLTLDLARLDVAVNDRPLEMTPTELRLLVALARRVGSTIYRQDLIALVWGSECLETPAAAEHMLHVALARLRRKIFPASDLIVTLPGIGVRLEAVAPGAPLPTTRRTTKLNGRWALDWERCRDCGRTDRQHNGRGYCTACHHRGLEQQARKRVTS